MFTECVNIATDLLCENPNNEVLIQYLGDAHKLHVGNLNANVLSAPGFHYAVRSRGAKKVNMARILHPPSLRRPNGTKKVKMARVKTQAPSL